MDALALGSQRSIGDSRLTNVQSIGVDVGGTFTDLVSVSDDGTVETRKVLSTPDDQSVGVEHAIRAIGADPSQVARIVHGTTVATNALLERAGARVVLLATEGFTDLLELRRQDRASLYDLSAHHPPAVVDPVHRVPVPERMTVDGPIRSLTRDLAVACARDAVAHEPDVVAIALLHAHSHDAHETLLEAALAEVAPSVDVVRSSAVYPEQREFERTATTCAEAYLRPAVARYLRRLEERLRSAGLPSPTVMTSSAGVREASDAARTAASLALSGPAGGVVGAAAALRAAGLGDALTIDIGGTSADVGLVIDGEPLVEPGGQVAGVPIALPRVLVETVSAGGGSVIWVDDGGALRVGPRSVGSTPGPASFGRGGTPALTDAHVALGNIAAARLSGGVTLDSARAVAALEPIARALGATVARTAVAAIAVADATMARALRRVSVERGIDPRRCVLVAFGGGGPLHACGLAESIGTTRVFVPPAAGVLSALGLAIAPERRDAMASIGERALTLSAESWAPRLESLVQLAGVVPGGSPRWWVRARFVGQGHEVDVPCTPQDAPAAVATRFAGVHLKRYGFVLDRDVELVSVRCAVTGAPWPLHFARRPMDASWDNALRRDDGATMDAVVQGPSAIQLPDATLLVASGWTARALPIGGWLVERESQ